MLNIIKKLVILSALLSVFSCCAYAPLNAEEAKLAKTRAAQERLNSTQQNANTVTKDIN